MTRSAAAESRRSWDTKVGTSRLHVVSTEGGCSAGGRRERGSAAAAVVVAGMKQDSDREEKTLPAGTNKWGRPAQEGHG